jgi:hypothetical protein
MIAIQIIMIILGLFSMTYIFLLGEWQQHNIIEKQLAYERSFLQFVTHDIEQASSANVVDGYLYLFMGDGISYRYHFKPSEKRLDRGIKKIGSASYTGRVTAAVQLEDLHYNVSEEGIELKYRILDSTEKLHFFRFRGN